MSLSFSSVFHTLAWYLITCYGAKPASPNIVFILTDDIGWNDVGFNGAQWPTPNIDWLHSNGVSLTNHYIHLMCSPSRSQFITGRYAMYSGYGQMLPWDYTEIGGIPVGQPTIASWLKQMGDYTTYGVGKWHLGYSSDVLLPTNRGFDHFFGFYQGAIHYDNLKYIDIKYGDSNHFDFWEDGEQMSQLAGDIAKRQENILHYQNTLDVRDATPYDEESEAYYSSASVFDDNTMYLYRDKILQYISNHQASVADEIDPFYMFVALQTIHGPLNEVPEKIDACKEILPSDATQRRQRYCQNMLLTDDVIGAIISKLHEDPAIWDNTLIVFTSDNGGDVANKGCNYPLRGTKGTLFDGNLKTIAVVSGGLIPSSVHGASRDALFSSLDWTPTLLKYANLLSKIDKADMKWDGMNQYDVIMNDEANKARDHIVMNIGTRSLESASIVFEYDDKLYKYISKRDDIDRWAYIRDDGWCVPDNEGNFVLVEDDDISLAQAVDNRYLFELSADVAEKTNLLQLEENVMNTQHVVNYAKEILTKYTEHYLYSEPLKFLWNRLPSGNPSVLGEGAFVAPFLSDDEYNEHLHKGFKSIDNLYVSDAMEKGVDVHDITPYSRALQATFFVPWEAPTRSRDTKEEEEEEESKQADAAQMILFLLFVSTVFMAIYFVYHYYQKYFAASAGEHGTGYKLLQNGMNERQDQTYGAV